MCFCTYQLEITLTVVNLFFLSVLLFCKIEKMANKLRLTTGTLNFVSHLLTVSVVVEQLGCCSRPYENLNRTRTVWNVCLFFSKYSYGRTIPVRLGNFKKLFQFVRYNFLWTINITQISNWYMYKQLNWEWTKNLIF